MLLKEGDKGKQVAEVQKLLSLLGYDLVIDGHFGSKTSRSVRSFQKKQYLTIDGVVGSRTYEALKGAQKRSAKEVDNATGHIYNEIEISKEHLLSSGQYIKQQFEKKQIYLHFTAGGPTARYVISGWDDNDPRIATSYVIDGNDGGIYECFNPDYWSFHLGIKGTRGKVDKHSIGIEICNWGPLDEKDGKFYGWPAKKLDKWLGRYEVKSEDVIKLDEPFRGYKYYHKISDEQIASVKGLLEYLCAYYDIPVNDSFDMSWFDYDESIYKQLKPGIWTHVNVRKDKYDLCPDQRILDMLNSIDK